MIENTIGCITHYNPKHLQLREDFLQICMYHVSQFAGEDKPKEEPNVECMAMILRVLETLTDHQRERFTFNAMYYAQRQGRQSPPLPAEIPVELSYSAISRLIYHTFSERTIGKAIVILLQLGFIKRMQEKKNDNPSYILCTEVVQQALMQHAQQQCSQASEHLTPASNFATSDGNFAAPASNFATSDGNFAAPASNFATNNRVSKRVNNISDKKTEVAESSVAFAIPITEDSISFTTPVEPPQTTPRPAKQRPNTPRPAKQSPESSPLQISPEGEMVFQRWCTVMGDVPLFRTARMLKACEELVPYHLTEDDLRSIMSYILKNDRKGFYKDRGIKLWDILTEYPGWASIHRLIIAEQAPQTFSRKNLSDIVREARKKYV